MQPKDYGAHGRPLLPLERYALVRKRRNLEHGSARHGALDAGVHDRKGAIGIPQVRPGLRKTRRTEIRVCKKIENCDAERLMTRYVTFMPQWGPKCQRLRMPKSAQLLRDLFPVQPGRRWYTIYTS